MQIASAYDFLYKRPKTVELEAEGVLYWNYLKESADVNWIQPAQNGVQGMGSFEQNI